MKYFEFNDPYYALIKEESGSKAFNLYNKLVADSDDNEHCVELSQFDAFVKFGLSKTEGGSHLTFQQAIEEFLDDENKLLLVDGGLL